MRRSCSKAVGVEPTVELGLWNKDIPLWAEGAVRIWLISQVGSNLIRRLSWGMTANSHQKFGDDSLFVGLGYRGPLDVAMFQLP